MDEAVEGVEGNRRISYITFSAAMNPGPVRTWTIQKASHQLSTYLYLRNCLPISNLFPRMGKQTGNACLSKAWGLPCVFITQCILREPSWDRQWSCVQSSWFKLIVYRSTMTVMQRTPIKNLVSFPIPHPLPGERALLVKWKQGGGGAGCRVLMPCWILHSLNILDICIASYAFQQNAQDTWQASSIQCNHS